MYSELWLVEPIENSQLKQISASVTVFASLRKQAPNWEKIKRIILIIKAEIGAFS